MANSKFCCFPLKNGLMGLAIVSLILLGIGFIVTPFCANSIEMELRKVSTEMNSHIDAEFYTKCMIGLILIGIIISGVPVVCFIIGVRNVSKNVMNLKKNINITFLKHGLFKELISVHCIFYCTIYLINKIMFIFQVIRNLINFSCIGLNMASVYSLFTVYIHSIQLVIRAEMIRNGNFSAYSKPILV